ncbi:MAG: amidohydrolase [Saprospiraceae bacterium]|nr:amidohydrolase [Candidatus Vicinibacter affinis]
MKITKDYIKSRAESIGPEIIDIRRDLHRHPELSFQEHRTSEKISQILTGWGVEFSSGWAGTGIVGVISGDLPAHSVIALRADMDALPIVEKSGLEFASVNEGKMHACGHDIHMSCLLGAIHILHNTRSSWGGTVKFIFQPGEEKLPGGASILINEGVLSNPKPDIIIGQHVQPNMEAGTAGICPGNSMASCDEIYITITGKGGHAAMPHLCIDPLLVASHFLIASQSLISKEKAPFAPAVLSFGKMNTLGGATNIIPDQIQLEGTLRCMDENLRNQLWARIEELLKGQCAAFGAEYLLRIEKGYPCLINNASAAEKWAELASDYIGAQNIAHVPPRLTSEDFAYYSHQIPACFYRLGTGPSSNVHTPEFKVDETSIVSGSGLMAWLSIGFLQYA